METKFLQRHWMHRYCIPHHTTDRICNTNIENGSFGRHVTHPITFSNPLAWKLNLFYYLFYFGCGHKFFWNYQPSRVQYSLIQKYTKPFTKYIRKLTNCKPTRIPSGKWLVQPNGITLNSCRASFRNQFLSANLHLKVPIPLSVAIHLLHCASHDPEVKTHSVEVHSILKETKGLWSWDKYKVLKVLIVQGTACKCLFFFHLSIPLLHLHAWVVWMQQVSSTHTEYNSIHISESGLILVWSTCKKHDWNLLRNALFHNSELCESPVF